jgi:phosphoribosylformimino-5-aminoimidazole carboxamide ribotide isomerase
MAFAAIDLRAGRVVQLVGGDPANERISLPDPAAVARHWMDAGFRALHVVDLDAALGNGSNDEAVDAILDIAAGQVDVQVGGGVRTTERAAQLLERGATRVVVGTRAVEDRLWLEEIVELWPGRAVVAADVNATEVVVRGWTEGSGLGAGEFLESLDKLQVGAVLVTDVTREGRLTGIDAIRFHRLRKGTRHPLIASGGIADRDDLEALAVAGVAGAVLGMSLYTGTLDASATARDFGTWR